MTEPSSVPASTKAATEWLEMYVSAISEAMNDSLLLYCQVGKDTRSLGCL